MMFEKKYLESTKLITSHYGEEYEHYYNAVVPPIFMNSLNIFNTIDDYYDSDKSDKNIYVYGRVQNSTVRILEEKIAALEHGKRAFMFASGMAAATTAVLTACRAGDNVVCIRTAYDPLKRFLTGYCKEHMNITTTFVLGNDIDELENAVTDETSLIVLESPSSVVFSLQDIEAIVNIAKKHNAMTYLDNSYCTPIFQQPLDMGVDFVMHTVSKYLGGHSDLIGGVLVLKDAELIQKISLQRELLGGIIGPMEGWLAIRGLRSLEARLEQHQKTALEVAKFLECHSKVRKVYYPGLPSNAQYELMKKQQTGNTGLLSFEIDGTLEQAKKLAESFTLFKIGVSWGGFESLVCMPYARQDDKLCKWLGAAQNIIRIHCGLEGTEALINDLASGLDKI